MPDSEEMLQRLVAGFWLALPVLVTLIVVASVLAVANFLLLGSRLGFQPSNRIARQLAMLALTAAGVVALVVSLPVGETTRGQLLSLLGILLSAAIALSSTTLIGNAMAGLMLRAVGNFRPGDFVQVDDRFGRVSERGLLHVEIQTEDRDLVTLPNLYLVSNPVKVVRSSGTMITATVSLGYDTPRTRVEELLVRAAHEAGLEEAYVQILDLGDFSVTYRACGFLAEVKQILSARTRLRAAMLDALHADGIEIVSATFMNQRVLPGDRPVIPEAEPVWRRRRASSSPAPEELVFDKAEAAGERSRMEEEQGSLNSRIQEIEAELESASHAAKSPLDEELAKVRLRLVEVTEALSVPPEETDASRGVRA